MFGAVREYKVQRGKIDELVERVRAEFIPMIERTPGFIGYSLAQVGSDGIVTTSTYDTREQAEASVTLAAGWVKEHLASLVTEPPRVTTGEVLVRHVVENAKATYGLMRRFETKPADVERTTRQIRDGLVPLLSGMPGFASYGLLLEGSRDRGVTLSAFADRASAEAAGERALVWVKENLADSKVVDVVGAEIKVRHVKATAAPS
jgi:heme-degrading monooxygenase HmoA